MELKQIGFLTARLWRNQLVNKCADNVVCTEEEHQK
jgi:hypothetical protein